MTKQQAERIDKFCKKHEEIFGLTSKVKIEDYGGSFNVVIHTTEPREYRISFTEFDEFGYFVAGVKYGRGGDPDRRIE
jgi:hypothetical protein